MLNRVLIVGLLILGYPAMTSAAKSLKRSDLSLLKMIDAPLAPLSQIDPTGRTMLYIERDAVVPLASIAVDSIGLAGEQLDPILWSAKRRSRYYAPSFYRLSDGKTTTIQIPKDLGVAAHKFSVDGTLLALALDSTRGIEIWIVTVATGTAKKVESLLLNDAFNGRSMQWVAGTSTLLFTARLPESASLVRETLDIPAIEESTGIKVQARSFPFLLKTESDRALFKKAATAQLYALDAQTMKARKVGKPQLFAAVDSAPDASHLLVETYAEPYSFAVPAQDFARQVSVWDLRTEKAQDVLDISLAESVPPEGVRTGPRDLGWQAGHPARLVWVEALDDGDPRKKVDHRDKLMTWDLPFAGSAVERFRTEARYEGMHFMPKDDQLLITDRDPDSDRVQVNFIDLADQSATRRILDYNAKDAYHLPGRIVTQPDGKGDARIVVDGENIFLDGQGRNPQGEQPFLDKLNIRTLAKERIFESAAASAFLEEFSFFMNRDLGILVLARQSPDSPPNLWSYDLKTRARKELTHRVDNVPEMTGAIKKPLIYTRIDGITLSGTLYLPKDYKQGTKLPAVVWAYPEEYRSRDAAGQVRVSDKRYSRPAPTGIQWLVTQGFAVLDNAAMPVIGDKDTGNNSFIAQTVADAEAAVEAMDKLGVVDKKRIAVGGHSYGAFMTANLLAHSQLFCAGIARSGAYNRSLTPFGFQSERRTFWEAKDFYMSVSPFAEAEKIKTPLLLIHGKNDNNPGTLTIQSERLYQAIRGLGGTARLVLLPYEAHGYSARENVRLVHEETLNWLDRWCVDGQGT